VVVAYLNMMSKQLPEKMEKTKNIFSQESWPLGYNTKTVLQK